MPATSYWRPNIINHPRSLAKTLCQSQIWKQSFSGSPSGQLCAEPIGQEFPASCMFWTPRIKVQQNIWRKVWHHSSRASCYAESDRMSSVSNWSVKIVYYIIPVKMISGLQHFGQRSSFVLFGSILAIIIHNLNRMCILLSIS